MQPGGVEIDVLSVGAVFSGNAIHIWYRQLDKVSPLLKLVLARLLAQHLGLCAILRLLTNGASS